MVAEKWKSEEGIEYMQHSRNKWEMNRVTYQRVWTDMDMEWNTMKGNLDQGNTNFKISDSG